MKKIVVIDVICFLMILLFTYAAVSKLMDVQMFRAQIEQTPILKPFAYWLAVVLPAAEIITAVALVLPRFRLMGLYSSVGLMALFTGFIVYVLNSGYHLPCSCGGVLSKMGWTTHLYFNIGFLLIALVGLILHPKKAPLTTYA